MPETGFAFLNCYDFFPVGAVARKGSPQTVGQLREKIRQLGATLRHVLDDRVPDLIGLAEVGGESLGLDVAARVARRPYQSVWSGAPQGQTGLVVLYNSNVLAQLQPAVLAVTGIAERVRWMAVLLQPVRGSRAPFWFVVNHWKSRLGGEERTRRDRHRAAREIGVFCRNAQLTSDAMLMVGDFNCEPWDSSFSLRPAEGGARWEDIQVVRERGIVLSDRTRYPYFYNPMWRWVGEPDAHDATGPG